MDEKGNPWRSIPLDVYEGHMQLENVAQLGALNEIMKSQMQYCRCASLMILGVAGGNGLEHAERGGYDKIYGVDINEAYLQESKRRHGDMDGRLEYICADLTDKNVKLPQAEAVIANLFIEYTGYDNFMSALGKICPQYVTCVIQINTDATFVSDSPYMEQLQSLQSVHRQMDDKQLIALMTSNGYRHEGSTDKHMSNGKILRRLDFRRA